MPDRIARSLSLLALFTLFLPSPAALAQCGAFLGEVANGGGGGNGQFRTPNSVVYLPSTNNVYVLESRNNRVQRLSTTPAYVAKWGSNGSGNGFFNRPVGMRADSNDNLYVADNLNCRVQVFSPTGTFLRKWGSCGGGTGQFANPRGVGIDSNDNVYVLEQNNGNRVQVFTSTGVYIRHWFAGGGPADIVVTIDDRVLVSKTSTNVIDIYSTTGTLLGSIGTPGSGPGQLSRPEGMSIDSSGNIFVADRNNDRVSIFNNAGTFLNTVGVSGTGPGQLSTPAGVDVDSAGNIYVSDQGRQALVKYGCSLAVCGNGSTEAGEACDDGNTADGDCCSSSCAYEASGSSCGSSADTICDNPDTCDGAGTCQANTEPGTVLCRNDAGECDVADYCDGAGNCAADAGEPGGTPCGSSSDTTCDNADTCDGAGSCQSNNEPGTVLCRNAVDDCDVDDYCDGAGACSADALAGSGTPCGSAADTTCDNADTCDGAGNCQDNHEPGTVLCRNAVDVCDADDYCDGAGNCSADAFAGSGTACGSPSSTICDNADTCDGAGGCQDNHEPASTLCRTDAGDCDVADYCDGAGSCGPDIFEPAATACGDPADTDCDNPDSCDGSGNCLLNYEPNGTVCDDLDVCSLDDECDTGQCVGLEPVILGACHWALLAGTDSTSAKAQLRGQSAVVTGSVCGSRAQIGDDVVVNGDVVCTADSGDGCRFRAQVVVNGDIVTGGSAITGRPSHTLLPGIDTGVVPAGTSTVQTANPEYELDATGNSALALDRVGECQGDMDDVSTDALALDGLGATHAPQGRVRLPSNSSLTLVATGALNVIDFDELRIGKRSTITLDGDSIPDVGFVLRVDRKFDLKLGTNVVLAGGASADRVILYGRRSCKFGLQVTGGGTVFCPNGKVKLDQNAAWSGSMIAGRGKVDLRHEADLSHTPLQLQAP